MKRIGSLFCLTLLVLALPASAQEPHTGAQSNQAKVDTLDNPDLLWLKKGFEGVGSVIGFFPDGLTFLSVGADEGMVFIRRTSDAEVLQSYPTGVHSSLAGFSAAHDIVAIGGNEGSILLFKAQSGELIHKIESGSTMVEALALSDDGKVVLTSGPYGDAKIRSWDVQSGTMLKEYAVVQHEVQASAISPDGQYVAVGAATGTVYVWELASGKEVKVFGTADGLVRMHFSHDGKLLATSGLLTGKNIVQLWSTNGWYPAHTLEGHVSPVNDCIFTPGDRFLVSAGNDALRLWDIDTEKQLYSYSYLNPSTHIPVVQRSVSVAPDSSSLISSTGGFLLQWQAHWSPASSAPEPSNPTSIQMTLIPNPANNSVMIRFTVPDGVPASVVRTSITDLQGREVIVLPQQVLQPGLQQIPVAIANLSNSRYLCTVQINNNHYTLPFIIQH